MTGRLRFCMITTFYPPYNFGGDGVFVWNLAGELAQRGHHVEVIHCMDAYRYLTRGEPDVGSCDLPHVKVHRLSNPLGAVSLLAAHQMGWPVFYGPRIRRILEGGFDVIHHHNISLVGGPEVLKYGRGIKLYTMHDYWLFCPTHVMFRFNRAACVRPRCLICTLTHRRPPQWWRYLRGWQSVLNQLDAVIAPSRYAMRVCHEKGLPARVVHLPSFTTEQSLCPTGGPVPALPEEPYFLFVGRLEKLKGVVELIALFRRYRGAHLVIAGSGADEHRLRRAARGGNVHFLGHVPHTHLGRLYRQALALIVPSLCFEIFPLVILEAFQQKTPVIVRNLGGMPESVAESGGGGLPSQRRPNSWQRWKKWRPMPHIGTSWAPAVTRPIGKNGRQKLT